MEINDRPSWKLMERLFKSHPWHGIPIGQNAPDEVTVFIEMVPTDTVKYEIDKESGYLRVDRPQKYSSLCPALYGFIPQTFCAEEVADRCMERTQLPNIAGDKDPLDVCVLTERNFSHGDVLVQAIPIGGLRMIDHKQADDKIIAVLKGDAMCANWRDISEIPADVLDRLRHYFLTYKQMPGSTTLTTDVKEIYGRDEALETIRRSQSDYRTHYGALENILTSTIG
jgi:inorganic pyrophosphatase